MVSSSLFKGFSHGSDSGAFLLCLLSVSDEADSVFLNEDQSKLRRDVAAPFRRKLEFKNILLSFFLDIKS